MTRLSNYLLPTDEGGPGRRRGGLPQAAGAGRDGAPARRRACGPTCRPDGGCIARSSRSSARRWTPIGAQEMLMPVLQPAELWRESGRYEIDELFKLKDRRGADLVLAMTHEEALTFHMAREVRSYRDLPKLLYHFQTKERDEPRPRAGRAAHARVHHEGRLHLRPRRGGPRPLLRAPRGRLRPHLRPRRARVVPGRVGRGDDGRHRRPRVHGALRGGRERRRALRRRLRGQRRGGERDARSRSRALPEPLDAPEAVDTPGATTIEPCRACSACPRAR